MPITAKQNTVDARQSALQPQQRDHTERGAEARARSSARRTPRSRRSSTSLAKLGPSGIIAPAPMRPNAEAEHHAADERVLRDELQPLLDLAEGLGPVDALVVRPLLAARDRQPVDDHRRHEERHRVER